MRHPISARRRTGAALYTLVLLTTILVSSIGLAALQLARVRGREFSDAQDTSAARLGSQSAMQLARQRLATSADWQNQLSGPWLIQDQACGAGSMSISISDPLDGTVSGNEESLLVTGIGKQGRAIQKLSMQVQRSVQSRACLKYGLVAGSGIQLSQSAVRCTSPIACSGDVQLSSSTVRGDVLASGTIIGTGVGGSATPGARPRLMPDSDRVFDYYLQNGTSLSFSAIPKWQQVQLLRNSSFESDSSSWYALTDATLSRSSTRAVSGSWSLRVSGRGSRDDGAAQDIALASLKNGNTYRLSLPFFPTANGTASAHLTLQSTGDGIQVYKLPDFACVKNGFGNFSWIQLEGNLTLTWSGTLTKATLSFDTSFNQDYYLDNVSLMDVTYPNNVAVIDHQLIGPGVNPLGSTNAQGIYIINCSNQDLMIGRSRLVGTLVLLNPGSGSCLTDYVSLEPAAAGMPCLLVSGHLKLAMNGKGFSEAAMNVNFNPPSTPYPYLGGGGNNALSDNYPAMLSGLIYATGSIQVTSKARIRGLVIADTIALSNADVVVQFDDQYLRQFPPGFRDTQSRLYPKSCSIARVVDN